MLKPVHPQLKPVAKALAQALRRPFHVKGRHHDVVSIRELPAGKFLGKRRHDKNRVCLPEFICQQPYRARGKCEISYSIRFVDAEAKITATEPPRRPAQELKPPAAKRVEAKERKLLPKIPHVQS